MACKIARYPTDRVVLGRADSAAITYRGKLWCDIYIYAREKRMVTKVSLILQTDSARWMICDAQCASLPLLSGTAAV